MKQAEKSGRGVGTFRTIKLLSLSVLILFFLTGCSYFQKEDNGDEELTRNLILYYAWLSTQATSLEGEQSGDGYYLKYYGKSGNVDVSLDLSATSDVYFMFTNVSEDTDVESSTISINGKSASGEASLNGDLSASGRRMESTSSLASSPTVNESAASFNNSTVPGDMNTTSPSKSVLSTDVSVQYSYAAGDTATFYDETTVLSSKKVSATVRYTGSDGSHSVVIWVDDSNWTGGSACGGSTSVTCVTQDMVDQLGPKFLTSGSGNDIYDWVTGILGDEWAATGYDNLISDENTIHILLYDIDSDKSLTGGVVGFFYAKDNFLKSSYDGSNEKLMFYLDAPMFAQKDDLSILTGLSYTPDSTWSISDYWPSEMVSTLAHEFQHMIHFYQTNVLLETTPESWVNEMASMQIEDLLSRKMGVKGPRGVDSETAGPGSDSNKYGYLPYYVYFPEYPVAYWSNGSSALYNYANKYAFGAFLLRSCDGATFLHNLVIGNAKTGTARVTRALSKTTTCADWDFESALRRFGAATMVSGITTSSADAPNLYNTGTWSSSTINGMTFDMGSINMFNYVQKGNTSVSGPYYYSSLGDIVNPVYATSNLYYKAASAVSGNLSYTVSLPSNVYLTVITLEK